MSEYFIVILEIPVFSVDTKHSFWVCFQFQFKGVVFGVASYPNIFKTQQKKRSAPNFSQLVRRRHLKMGTWGKRTRKGSFQFKPSEKLCST